MIQSIRARCFKSWRDTGVVNFSPLTGLFGRNSSGKTSLMQLILMLKQTVESADRRQVLNTGDDKSLVDLGTFYDLIHGHDSSSTLQIDLSWNLPSALKISDPERENRILFETDHLAFHTSVREEESRPTVDSFTYTFDGYSFGMKRTNGEPKRDTYELVANGYTALRALGRAWPLPSPVKCYGFPDEAIAYYQNTGFLRFLTLKFEELFGRVNYLGPLREYPKRSYLWAAERPQDVGRRGERAVAALLSARTDRLTTQKAKGRGNRRFLIEERILAWMKEMNVIHSFSLQPIGKNRKDYEFRVKMSETSPEVLITDVGFGVSQLLPVLVLCYYAPMGSTILLEQPEIHLHPAVQAALADVFIEVVNARGVQIIVESHSEHLLRRIQRRIAEERMGSDRTALYFCESLRGVSRIERLRINTIGEIDNWPDGFLGDELGELVAMKTAAMQRRQK